jgi:hypothetical protein
MLRPRPRRGRISVRFVERIQNSFRVLGLSTLKQLPWVTVVAFTGNRARIGGDTDRRVVVAVLIRRDVPLATYKHPDLLPYITKERPKRLAAAFTLVRAWVQAGAPSKIERLDSFEHWANTVAAMIKWAGGGDVRELVRDDVGTESDGDEYTLLATIHDWLTAKERRDFTVKELTDDRRAVCHERAEDVVLGKEPVLHQELRAAVEVFAGFTDKGEARPTRTTRARGVNLGPLRTLRPMSISPPSEWRSTWRPRRPSRAHAYVDDRRSSARPG